jgi:gas vesicle protein
MFFKKQSSVAKFGKFFFTFVAGAAVGAAAGLLFAPQAGKKLQKELKNGIEDLTEKALKLATA